MLRSSRWIRARLARAASDDVGSAALEFITVGCLLLVPLVYLIVALGAIQSHALGVESGARHIARAVSQATDAAAAQLRADAVLRTTVEEYGLDASAVQIALSCMPAGEDCPEAGSTVTVTITTRVSLPLVPPVLGLDRIASVPVEASSTQRVSRFWGAE